MTEFKPINRYPDKPQHLRNILIAIEIEQGKPSSDVAKQFKLSINRTRQIYRVMMGKIYEKYCGESFIRSLETGECFNYPGMISLLKQYHENYSLWAKI